MVALQVVWDVLEDGGGSGGCFWMVVVESGWMVVLSEGGLASAKRPSLDSSVEVAAVGRCW